MFQSFEKRFKQVIMKMNLQSLNSFNPKSLKSVVNKRMFNRPSNTDYFSAEDLNKVTALEYICFRNFGRKSPSLDEEKEITEEIIKILVAKGADLNIKHPSWTAYSNTLLMESIACESKCLWLTKILIDVATTSEHNRKSLILGDGVKDDSPKNMANPLIFSILTGQSDEIILHLLNSISDEDLKVCLAATYEGLSPLHLVCFVRRNVIIEALVKKGADINAKDIVGLKPADYYCEDLHGNSLDHNFTSYAALAFSLKEKDGKAMLTIVSKGYTTYNNQYPIFCNICSMFSVPMLIEYREKNKINDKIKNILNTNLNKIINTKLEIATLIIDILSIFSKFQNEINQENDASIVYTLLAIICIHPFLANIPEEILLEIFEVIKRFMDIIKVLNKNIELTSENLIKKLFNAVEESQKKHLDVYMLKSLLDGAFSHVGMPSYPSQQLVYFLRNIEGWGKIKHDELIGVIDIDNFKANIAEMSEDGLEAIRQFLNRKDFAVSPKFAVKSQHIKKLVYDKVKSRLVRDFDKTIAKITP